MSRRYDSRTTIFSPEGRLYQVEYAMEAISNAGAAIGMLAKDGVVLIAEKKIISKVGECIWKPAHNPYDLSEPATHEWVSCHPCAMAIR